MEESFVHISRIFNEKDPVKCAKSIKAFTKLLYNITNIPFPDNLTLCLLSKFSEAATHAERAENLLVCKEFLTLFTIYLKNSHNSSYKQHFVPLISQGLKLTDHILLNFSSWRISAEASLLLDYFESIFNAFDGDYFLEFQNGKEIPYELTLIGATVHSLLSFTELGSKSSKPFNIFNKIAKYLDRTVISLFYPGLVSRLVKYILLTTNDLLIERCFDTLSLWIVKVLSITHYNIKFEDKLRSVSKNGEYPLEVEIATKDNPELKDIILNTNTLLASLTSYRSDNPKIITAFMKFNHTILNNCSHFISYDVSYNFIANILQYNDYKVNKHAIRSNTRVSAMARDVVSRSMLSDNFDESIQIFQGYLIHNNNTLDVFVVSNWFLRLLEQNFDEEIYNDDKSISSYLKHGKEVQNVISNYYKNYLSESQRLEVLETILSTLTESISKDSAILASKYPYNLRQFPIDSSEIELSPLTVPMLANVGILAESLNAIPHLLSLVSLATTLIGSLIPKNLENEEKLIICNVYWTLTKCKIDYTYPLQTLIFYSIHLACLGGSVSKFALEFIKNLDGGIQSMLSTCSGILINTCRSIIKSHDFSSNKDVYKLSMANNVIGFVGRYGLEKGNIALSEFALNVLDIPVFLNSRSEISIAKPLMEDANLIEYDEEFVITILNNTLLSFQKEIERDRGYREKITDGGIDRGINDFISNDDLVSIPEDVLSPIIPIDSLGKYGLYRRVATSVIARARHAMLLSDRYKLACKASVAVLLSLYILSTDVSELLPRIAEIFPMVLRNIKSSVTLSAYAIVMLRYSTLITPDFVRHKQPEIVENIHERLMGMTIATDADELHLSSKFVFQCFALEYLVVVTQTKQFCMEKIFKIALYFNERNVSVKIRELIRKLWNNLFDIDPNRVVLLSKLMESGNEDLEILLKDVIGVTKIDLRDQAELPIDYEQLKLRIPSSIQLNRAIDIA